MPELPEVETVVRTLNQLVTDKHITNVSVHLPRIIQRPDDPAVFAALLQGQTIRGIERRGKFLRFLLDDLVLVSHLRMEGRYGLYRKDEPVEKHTHVVFHFDDGTELRYRDVRQFGTMHLFAPGEEFVQPPLHKLGLEPLDPAFTFEAFRKAIGGRTTKIKPLLLNQEVIVGIGNIYADEALFAAGLHPEREACSLTKPELLRLHEAIVTTLQEAVDAGGSSIKSYVNGQGEMGMFQQQLNAYGRKDQPCPRCGGAILKTVLGGRGTHFCPSCQKLKRIPGRPAGPRNAASAGRRPRGNAAPSGSPTQGE
ncbi:formamidopyrimidine-DNA glycosylase [Paenibacillus sp. J31TS4]|uniref:DNA-formamidopyrimidine glycosylase n=1 Tax=Paenibacillus sp. J31TS4 TaxID=2807195 RepID=UPI001B192923|nr:DNA-formamidopyrimidine glycosylase [Paenibacillus sp. J31TS4]GIP38222.1 formamidopyrimidine-DNA glycosylase [Paenibacillus sp. J31TS4]